MMKCFFEHNWGWPRKRGNKDVQVCLHCGAERESKVDFGGPRYHRTQDGIREARPAELPIAAPRLAPYVVRRASSAA